MPRVSKYTLDLLAPIVAASSSINQVLVALNLKQPAYTYIKHRIDLYKLDTSHFNANGPRKGHRPKRYTDEEIFVENAPFDLRGTHGPNVRKRFIARGHEEICAKCGTGPIWNDMPLKLQLDHINGNNRDNRECNLRFLCPNCHSQTKTFAGRNKKKYDQDTY